MGTVKSYHSNKGGPSTFALLVDDINKMSEPEQKLLWMQINKEKISSFAKEVDQSVAPHNFSPIEIEELITEAKKSGSRKKS